MPSSVEAPPGFHPHASGLLVPEAVARVREVCTKAELKAVERALRILKQHRVMVQMACPEPGCRGEKLQKIPGIGGDVTLRCEHRDLVFSNTI